MKTNLMCPFCGKAMSITSRDWYERNEVGVIELECENCNLSIKEYGFHYGFGDGEGYETLKKILISRAVIA